MSRRRHPGRTPPGHTCIFNACPNGVPTGHKLCDPHIGELEQIVIAQRWAGRMTPAQIAAAEQIAAGMIDANLHGEGDTFHALLPGDIAAALRVIIGLTTVGTRLVEAIRAEPDQVMADLRAGTERQLHRASRGSN